MRRVCVLVLACGLLVPAPASAVQRTIVTFRDQTALRDAVRTLSGRTGFALRSEPILVVDATPADLLRLRGVVSSEPDAVARVHLPTATTASRARAVWGPVAGPPLRDADGRVVDGTGVGVAIVDTGVDGTNPDLAGRIARNLKAVSPGRLADPDDGTADLFVDVVSSDTTGGHGTHVAGIVAGSGASSGGRATGVAPGASIYGFGVGEGIGITVSNALAAFDWIATYHDKVDPPIRVVNDSWGPGLGGEGNEAVVRMTDRLVAEGLVMTWSAGNGDLAGDGGDGSFSRVNPYARNPTPGVIAVANYDDEGTGTRDGSLHPSSSRGAIADASTWPDISAPGTVIYAAAGSTGVANAPFKGLQVFSSLFEPGPNVFGNAVDQFLGTVAFRLGGRTSPEASIDWVIWTRPAVAYNAHRDRMVTSEGGVLPGPYTEELAALRFYGDVPDAAGPLHPPGTSAASVGPDDAVLFTRELGTADPIRVQVTSPSGTSRTFSVRFGCESGCTSELDLGTAFAGEPADGTWIVSPGPTVVTENVLDALNPAYVELTGTSMAAPHVAGVAALVLQADPTLTPASVELLLEETAYPFGDGYAPSGSSFDKGHGLVDAYAAVLAALA